MPKADRIEALKNNLDFYKETLNQVYSSRYTFENSIGESALELLPPIFDD